NQRLRNEVGWTHTGGRLWCARYGQPCRDRPYHPLISLIELGLGVPLRLAPLAAPYQQHIAVRLAAAAQCIVDRMNRVMMCRCPPFCFKLLPNLTRCLWCSAHNERKQLGTGFFQAQTVEAAVLRHWSLGTLHWQRLIHLWSGNPLHCWEFAAGE